MGKDYRTGLIAGTVLVVVALIWVATRPALTPRPRAALDTRNEELFALPGDLTGSAAAETVPADSSTDSPRTGAGGRDPQTAQDTEANLPDLTIYQRSEPIKTTRFHIVRRGETLSAIAQQYYGSSNNWQKILAANQGVKDANKIAPGTKLIIPE